jgi:hypothetical protein
MAFDYTRAPMKGARSFVWIVMALVLSGCASGPKKPPVGTLEPDKFLWERGGEELNKKHWLTSREYFRQLMDSYPQSQYRADAKLGLADSYLGEVRPNRLSLRSTSTASSSRSIRPTGARTTRSSSWGCAISTRCTDPIAIKPRRRMRSPS